MALTLRLHRDVPDDIAEIVSYLHERSEDAASRFPAAVLETAEALVATPGMGRIWRSSDARLDGVRSVTIRGFRNHLLFHRHRGSALAVMLIVHGSREWQQALAGRLNRS